MNRLGLLRKLGTTSCVRGESAISRLGVADWMSVSSLGSSVKILPIRVSIWGPAGIQKSEQEPVEAWVGQGASIHSVTPETDGTGSLLETTPGGLPGKTRLRRQSE